MLVPHTLHSRARCLLERLNNGITTTRDEDIMPVLEEFTKEVKSSIDRRAE